MSEELNTVTGTTSPDSQVSAAPVMPPPENSEPTDVPKVDAGEFSQEAPTTAESAPQDPAPVDPIDETGNPAEPLKAKIETPDGDQLPPPPAEIPASETPAEATPAEQKPEDPDPTEEDIEKVIAVIKQTGKFNKVFLALETSIPSGTIRKIIPILEERKILGMRGATKVVLIETAKTPKKVEKPLPAEKPQPEPRKRVTDYDRLTMWKDSLLEKGGFQNEELREAIAQYALRNPGFNPEEKRGRTLITMLNRWAQFTRDRLKFFYASDVDELHKMLLKFVSNNPFGNGPVEWNAISSDEQHDIVRKFFGIDKRLREYTSNDRIIQQVVMAAEHPKTDVNKTMGGSYAERFMYLILAILAFATDERFFADIIHTSPSQIYLERKVGKTPNWNDGTKCLECGAELTTDTSGNIVCSNMLCINHYPKAATETWTPSAPSDGDQQSGGDRPRKNWKKRRDSSDNEDQRGFDRARNKGKRWRENQGEETTVGGEGGEGRTITAGEDKGFTPFENLNVPHTDAPCEEPEPPTAE